MNIGMAFHSGHLLVLAGRAFERSQSYRSESEVSISLAAAAFEGFINEAAHFAKHHADSREAEAFSEILYEAEEARLQPVTKLRFGLFALSGTMPGKGEHLIQRLGVLMKIRNSLLHVRPDVAFLVDDSGDGAPRPPSEILHLVSAGVITIPQSQSFTWRQVLSVPEAARWSINTAVAGIKSIPAACPAGKLKDVLEFRVRDLKEI